MENRDDSYCLLPFSFNLTIISLISPHLISLLFKMHSRKVDSLKYIEISKNQKRIGRFVWFQKSYKRKIYFEPCFQLLKVNDLGQFEKSQQVYLSEKEREAISAILNTVIHDAENLGLVPIYEAKSGKESTMIRSSTSVIEYMKSQHTT